MAHQHLAPLCELDLFTSCAIQNSIVSGRVHHYRPNSLISAASVIEIPITTSEDQVLFLNRSWLKIKIQISAEKSGITNADWGNISLVNNALHSIFDQVTLFIGEKQISGNTSSYNLNAYFQTILGYSDQAKKGMLSGQGFFPIEGDINDSVVPELQALTQPPGTEAKKSRDIELVGRLCLDLCNQYKALIGGCNLVLKLYPAPASFYTIGPDNIKIGYNMKDVEFCVYTANLSPDVFEAHKKALKLSPARYQLIRTELYNTTIASGSSSFQYDNAIRGQLPRRLFVAFSRSKALIGDKSLNPYKFSHHKLNSLSIWKNGELINGKPFRPDFEKGLFMNEYNALYFALNEDSFDPKVSLSRKQFANGNTIFAVNLSEDLSAGNDCDGHVNQRTHGQIIRSFWRGAHRSSLSASICRV